MVGDASGGFSVEVRCLVHVMMVLAVDDVAQTMTVILDVLVEWHDPDLAWLPGDYDNITKVSLCFLFFSDLAWLPGDYYNIKRSYRYVDADEIREIRGTRKTDGSIGHEGNFVCDACFDG